MKLGPFKLWPRKRGSEDLPDPKDPDLLRVLMVCSGNICRSPTAEGVLRTKLQRAGLGRQVLVDSAGIHGFHIAEPPDPRAVQHAGRRGYDLTRLRARRVRDADFNTFHWMLAMDRSHHDWLVERAPAGSMAQVDLFLPASGLPDPEEVPDPYYGAADGFERVLDLVERACDGLIRRMSTEILTAPR